MFLSRMPDKDGRAGNQQQVTDGKSAAEHEKHSPKDCMALETHQAALGKSLRHTSTSQISSDLRLGESDNHS